LRAAMTIHRAKGRQFDTVVIPYVGESSFDSSAKARRRLYVAMTRAQRRLHLLVPTEEPSPLLAWR
jgi:superfamily I DNA/RNA helicase